jgi:phenylalanyl-tRNA synthetase beta chain
MDLLIPNNWLRDYLETKATPREFQKYLSLSGPTVDRINGTGKNVVYEIEVTTNRPDAMSVYGIAREAAAILPRYGIKAKLIEPKPKANQSFSKSVKYLSLNVSPKVVQRYMAILINNIEVKQSPETIQERLKLVNERPINNIVDISNYIMHATGQPLHMFDYDKIGGHKMKLRLSKKGEKVITLDRKEHILGNGDMVIEDGDGRIIDLAGIMGGLNSAIDDKTKNVLLVMQTYNPANIRKTAMSLDKWTHAARLFEKGLDAEQVEQVMRMAIDMTVQYAKGSPASQILDLYVEKPQVKQLTVEKDLVKNSLGLELSQKEITNILNSLGFKTEWDNENLVVTPPSYRSKDIQIQEDVIEEIARVYGYHNIPGVLMSGQLPAPIEESTFDFENKVKTILSGLGASEVYTLSLVSKGEAGDKALKLSNPLGGDTEYLRTSLQPSLIKAVDENKHWDKPLHLFEMSNIYIHQKSDLPKEIMILAGIFSNYKYREAKGVVEALLNELYISNNDLFMLTPVPGTSYLYYEVEVEELRKHSEEYPTFKPIPQFPAQIEDITLVLGERTQVGDLIKAMLKTDKRLNAVELVDVYNDAHTFRVWFQDLSKTLTNEEVSAIRSKMLSEVSKRFAVTIKD